METLTIGYEGSTNHLGFNKTFRFAVIVGF
jgi:hypothetical protein